MKLKKQKQAKKLIPRKVCTPGSFLDDQSVENSSGSDSEDADKQTKKSIPQQIPTVPAVLTVKMTKPTLEKLLLWKKPKNKPAKSRSQKCVHIGKFF